MDNKSELVLASINKVDLSQGRPILIVELPDSRRTISLNVSLFSIGRHPSNSLVVTDKHASRYHATIAWLKYKNNTQKEECAYWIIDGKGKRKRSQNGIQINGVNKLLHRLKSGDIISIGSNIKITYKYITYNTEKDSQLNTIYYL